MLKKILLSAVALFLCAGHAFAAVEINTADQAELDSVVGIGPSTSKAILDERKKGGNFKDWSDLEGRVKGIGEKNAVKLSAAGLVINGQPRSAVAPAAKSSKPAKGQIDVIKATDTKAGDAKASDAKPAGKVQ